MHLENVELEHRAAGSNKELLDNQLLWVHKFISNAIVDHSIYQNILLDLTNVMIQIQCFLG